MRFKKYITSKKKIGFTIIESLVYIFLTTMILVEGINLYVLMYKSYIDAAKQTIKYNNYKNFYINLDNIIGEGGLEEILVDDTYILFSKNSKSNNLDKMIISNEGNIIVKYSRYNATETANTMLKDVDNLQVKKKGKLIYLIVRDKDGREFIRCI